MPKQKSPPSTQAPPLVTPSDSQDNVSEGVAVNVETEEIEGDEDDYFDARDEASKISSRALRPSVSGPSSFRKTPVSSAVDALEEDEEDEDDYFDAREEAPTISLYTSQPQSSGPGSFREAPASPVTIQSQNTARHPSIPPSLLDYVMVDLESIPPLTFHANPPIRAAPAPPYRSSNAHGHMSAWQLVLPQVSSSSRNTETSVTDLSALSRSEGFDTETSLGEVVESPQMEGRQSPDQMTADQLKATWRRVGAQVNEVVRELFERSKKTVIGDGTYVGFINAVLDNVPNASAVEEDASSFGHLIYVQTGPSVTRRVADIMHGDIIVLQDAKLKGYKGLKPYHQNVGEGTPVVAVIDELRSKKSELKVYQACHQAGNQVRHTMNHVSTILIRLFSPSSLPLIGWKI
jgi:myosin tail region-interacting protein MTI1